MKTKLLSLLLVLALLAGMGVPTFASSTTDSDYYIPSPDVKPSSIRLNRSEALIYTGSPYQLTATVTPSDAYVSLNWRSDNSNVATVGPDGTVEGIRAGTATIYVSTDNGLSANCRITVRAAGQSVDATSIEMSLSKMTVRVDQSRHLSVLLLPVDASKDDVSWRSSNENIAKVDDLGKVTGISVGTATITATAGSGVSASTTVTVSAKSGDSKVIPDEKPVASTSSGERVTASDARATVEKAATETKKGEVGIASFKNKRHLAPSVISAAAYSARQADRDIRLRFITTDDNGKTLASMTIDPQVTEKRTSTLYTMIYTSSKNTKSALKTFRKYYSNKMTAREFSHLGDFECPVQVAAKVDLKGMSTANLQFYSYSKSHNTFDLIAVSDLRVDDSGFLRFTTNTGGIIIISDGKLQK